MAEEMSEVIYMVNCDACGSLQPIETVQTEWIDGEPVTWEHRCATCGTACGFGMNGGTVELGVVRDSVLSGDNDIWIYADPPPGQT